MGWKGLVCGARGLTPASPPSHLPAYLVAAFAKRLARLALTAPPEALLMVLPFICNLLRRHPACRVLVHRPRGPGECSGLGPTGGWCGAGGRGAQVWVCLALELDADPYDPDEEDPAQSRALESSLWELQVRPGCPILSHHCELPTCPHTHRFLLLPLPSLSLWLPGGTLISIGSYHSAPSVGCWEASQPQG